MADRCEGCVHCRFIRGAVRGVMDCDPDEWYCDLDEDIYFYMPDDELLKELLATGKYDDPDDVDLSCPHYKYDDPYDEPDY